MKVFVYSRKGHKRLQVIKQVISINCYDYHWHITDVEGNNYHINKDTSVISVYAW